MAEPAPPARLLALDLETTGLEPRRDAIVALGLVLTLTFVLLLVASRLGALLGVTGQNVITRVFGILLAALSVQFIFDGVRESGLLPV